MPKETRDTRSDSENKSGGGGGDGDGLDQAAEQVAQLADNKLALLFIEANERARNSDSPEICELFVEEKQTYATVEHVPDPKFLESIYESLANKEIHHKKLLEEGIPTNIFLRFFDYVKKLFSTNKLVEKEISLSPAHWKFFYVCHKNWKRKNMAYLNDFSSLTELWLRSKAKTQRILKIEFLTLFFASIFCLTLMFLFSRNFASTNYARLQFANVWANIIFSISATSLVLFLLPPFFLMVLWFVNVNHLHTSKNFHFFLFLFFTLAIFFLCVAIFNAALFYLINWKYGMVASDNSKVK